MRLGERFLFTICYGKSLLVVQLLPAVFFTDVILDTVLINTWLVSSFILYFISTVIQRSPGEDGWVGRATAAKSDRTEDHLWSSTAHLSNPLSDAGTVKVGFCSLDRGHQHWQYHSQVCEYNLSVDEKACLESCDKEHF